jgi:hypothetical protein
MVVVGGGGGEMVGSAGAAAAATDGAAVEGAGNRRGEWRVCGGATLDVNSEAQSASGSDIAGYHVADVADVVDDAGDAGFGACHGEQAKILESSQYTVAVYSKYTRTLTFENFRSRRGVGRAGRGC